MEFNGQEVECRILQEIAVDDGELVEISDNYFAQADNGAVYYFGEVVDDYEGWSKTNFSFVAEQMVNGVKLKLLPPLVYSPKIMPVEKHLGVLIYADPEREARAMNLTLLQATDENGQEVVTPSRNGGGSPCSGEFLDDP